MEIGIVTLFGVFNIGAFLQAYSLYNILKEMGHNVYFAKLKDQPKLNMLQLKNEIISKNPVMLYYNLKKYRYFNKSWGKLPVSRNNDFEIAIIGSDSLWDYTERTMGFIPEFFTLKLMKVNRFISYAPSFGTISSNDHIIQSAIDGIKEIDCISIRDNNSAKIIKEIVGRDCIAVLDPTFLWDFKEVKIIPNYKDYILIYGDFPIPIRESIIEFAKKNKKRLISVGTNNFWCDKSLAVTPLNFIGYLKSADYVITSMYHGTILSLNFNKNVCFYVQGKRKLKFDFLVNDSIFAQRCITENTKDISELFKIPINYSYINEYLNIKKNESIKFIKDSISN